MMIRPHAPEKPPALAAGGLSLLLLLVAAMARAGEPAAPVITGPVAAPAAPGDACMIIPFMRQSRI